MGLNIENATIGYDQVGLENLITAVNVEAIPNTCEALRKGSNGCREVVNSVWVGASADAFNDRLSDDTELMIESLKEISESIESQMRQIGANVENYDQQIAEQISSQQ